jgi:hypothetical protein
MTEQQGWISNPFAYGAIGFYDKGRKVGSIAVCAEDQVRGWVGPRKVYDGDDEKDAMRTVEREYYKKSMGAANTVEDKYHD